MSKTKTIQVKNLFNKTNYFTNTSLRNIFTNKTDTKTSAIKFPLLSNLNNNKLQEKKNKNSFLHNNNISEKNKINNTFYTIKRQVHNSISRTKSDFNRSTQKKFEHLRFKNIFHYDSCEKIRNRIYYKEINKELHDKSKNYNKLLFNLIQKNKDAKKGELNIKMNMINEIEKNIIKKRKENQRLQNKKMIKSFKSYNYINFKNNMNKSLEKQNILDKKIRGILDNIENKFDNIFIDVMDKKYTLKQIQQIKQKEKKLFRHSSSDIKIKN